MPIWTGSKTYEVAAPIAIDMPGASFSRRPTTRLTAEFARFVNPDAFAPLAEAAAALELVGALDDDQAVGAPLARGFNQHDSSENGAE